MKKFLKDLGKGAEDFLYLCSNFPNRWYEKVKQDIFIGSQIINIIWHENFERNFNCTELTAWKAIK